MKLTISFLLLLLLTLTSYGQSDSEQYHAAIKTQLQEMTNMMVKGDFKSYVEFLYPNALELAGGKEQLIQQLTNQTKELKAGGMVLTGATFSEPSALIRVGNELQCLIQEKLLMTVPIGKMTVSSTIIALSQDNGKKWYFLDTVGKNKSAIKAILPSLSDKHLFPENPPPVVTKE